MDHRAVVDRTGVSETTVQAEQAIFTSIRSPLGQGYSLVAASRGIVAEEKREIVQCAPSHGTLCDPSAEAVGLASFTLRSGRRCIFLSRPAGVEHTARGGYRVHTQVLVMEPAAFRRFHCDPLRVEASAASAKVPSPTTSPPTRLSPLILAVPANAAIGGKAAAADAARLAGILSRVLAGRRVLVVGTPVPQAALRNLLVATPLAFRQRLSLSYGLKFSPSRSFQVVFADADRNEAERILRDNDIDLLWWQSPPKVRSPFDAWLGLAARHWISGRHDELDRLAAQLEREESARVLEQIVRLRADTERVKQADGELLDELIQAHSQTRPGSEAHARLLREFNNAAETRRASLRAAAEKACGESDAQVDDGAGHEHPQRAKPSSADVSHVRPH